MMVKFINAYTGTEMWVAEDRVEEYKAAGHKLAADVAEAVKPTKDEEPKPKRRKTTKK